jgi:hypothetical protein
MGRRNHYHVYVIKLSNIICNRADKVVVLRFLQRVSSQSRQQLTRLVKRGCARSPLENRYRAPQQGFAHTYTAADVRLRAHTDSLHGAKTGRVDLFSTDPENNSSL